MNLFIIFTSADKALQTFRFQGEMGSILAREANVPPLKLMNPCLLAPLKWCGMCLL